MKKRCPRCGTKMSALSRVCTGCDLNFEKFESATNWSAKNAMRAGEADRVLMRTGCPTDVKRWKLLLMAIFLGFMGGHHYYIGRYKMGVFYTVFFIVGIVNAVITTFMSSVVNGDWYQILTVLTLVWGVVLIMWLLDVCKIVFNRFRIPVSRE